MTNAILIPVWSHYPDCRTFPITTLTPNALLMSSDVITAKHHHSIAFTDLVMFCEILRYTHQLRPLVQLSKDDTWITYRGGPLTTPHLSPRVVLTGEDDVVVNVFQAFFENGPTITPILNDFVILNMEEIIRTMAGHTPGRWPVIQTTP